MNIIFSDAEVNEYGLICTKSDELVDSWKQLGLPYLFWFYRQLSLRDKLRFKNLENKMLLHLTINEKELDYMNFKNLKTVYWVQINNGGDRKY